MYMYISTKCMYISTTRPQGWGGCLKPLYKVILNHTAWFSFRRCARLNCFKIPTILIGGGDWSGNIFKIFEPHIFLAF